MKTDARAKLDKANRPATLGRAGGLIQNDFAGNVEKIIIMTTKRIRASGRAARREACLLHGWRKSAREIKFARNENLSVRDRRRARKPAKSACAVRACAVHGVRQVGELCRG